ncbi:DUF2798 domain-containing protein [Vibrio sp. JPW-9-11-11]|uniref:DUF2798 domain-containing protein n=1 Tax=Vibrio sp. JPW-9-11-11 TaxID=1416532 RepID=UPI0015943498|nr:DUF2798 domain-containing protein [Vibrio sp. JPW-9-11-11]NVD08722.1 DUF2798 domain-containing protein [Vibrio sp. JPW-9-11-11]
MTRKEKLFQAVLGSLFMALMMSGVISLSKSGLNVEWLEAWANAFVVAWPVAFVLNVTIMPQVRRFATWLANLS